MPEVERNLRFAAAVKRALGGVTQRGARRETGVSATYVGDMLWGVVPSFRKLEQFARGLGTRGEAARELFESAGYAVPADLVEPEPEVSIGALIDQLAARVADRGELTYEPDLEEFTIYGYRGAENLCPEDVETVNRIVREVLANRRRRTG